MILTEDNIKRLHKKYATTAELFDEVYTHCRIIADIASHLIEERCGSILADPRLVRIGCLLHDIGIYRLYDENGVRHADKEYIEHGILGWDILKSEGLPEEICRFASCHTGMGLSKEEVHAQKLPMPVADYAARTVEERLVMYADKFHSKISPPAFITAQNRSRRIQRFGEHKVMRFEGCVQEFGLPNLESMAKKWGHVIHG